MMRLPLTILLTLLCAAPARADQCIPREILYLHGPRNGSAVPPGVRFVLTLTTGCSALPPGSSRLRLLDPAGKTVALARTRWHGYTELRPPRSLKPGLHRLQRLPPGSKPGAWKTLTAVRVAGPADRSPPRLSGTLSVTVKKTRGSVYLSPCHAKEGSVLAWRARFAAAADDTTRAGELRHVLQRRRTASDPWQVVQYITAGAGTVQRRWTEDHGGWGGRWTFRLLARDLSGNTTAGPLSARVAAPDRR